MRLEDHEGPKCTNAKWIDQLYGVLDAVGEKERS